jgi:MFS family permease
VTIDRDTMFSRVTRALQHRNYRLFFGGQTVSLTGTWITRVATSWLVYRLTGSELLLGVVGFCGQIPTLLLTPLAGVLVDRIDRRRMLVVTQVLSLLQSAALAVLTLTDVITVTQLLVLQLAQGAINAFDMPGRQSFMVEMVEDRRDLPNAIALNSMMVNGSRVIGPSIGGILIAAVGEGWCFAADALSYVAVIWSLLAMRMPRSKPSTTQAHPFEDFRRGWSYVASSLPIRSTLTLVAISSIMGMPYTVLMPAMAAEVLGGGPNTLGALMTAVGVGALAGAIYLASRRSIVGLGRVILLGTLLFGASLVVFSLSHRMSIALVALAASGAGFIVQMASTNTILQTIVAEDFRGRLMGFYTMAMLGTVPIGSLLAGVVANRAGAPMTIRLGGLLVIVGGIWFAYALPSIRAIVRPIYIERGIITVPSVDVDTGAKTL